MPSFASSDSSLRQRDTPAQQADPLTEVFRNPNPEKSEGRDNEIVKRQKPQPVLRPEPSLAYGPDSIAFEEQVRAEDLAARKAEFFRKRNAEKRKSRKQKHSR
ncbi:MAG: hypothetical protein AAGI89_02050 [Pseudomonadota bacterium]